MMELKQIQLVVPNIGCHSPILWPDNNVDIRQFCKTPDYDQ